MGRIQCDHTIRLGISKVISLGSNTKLPDLFKELKIDTASKTLSSKDIGTIVDLTVKTIKSLREDGYEPIVFLPPLESNAIIAMYIAACIEKTTVITPENTPEDVKEYKINNIELPLFPFLEFRGNEKFIFGKICELTQVKGKEISTKELFNSIRGEKKYDQLYSRTRSKYMRNEGLAAYKQIQRIIIKLRDLGLVDVKEESKQLLLKSTSFGELIFKQSEIK